MNAEDNAKKTPEERAEQLLLDNGMEGAKFLTGYAYDTAIIGFTNDNRVVYSYDKMIEWLMIEEEMSMEEAMEWIDYNTLRAIGYMGPDGPIVMFPLSEE